MVADALSRINIDELKKINENIQILKVQTRSMKLDNKITNENSEIKETNINHMHVIEGKFVRKYAQMKLNFIKNQFKLRVYLKRKCIYYYKRKLKQKN